MCTKNEDMLRQKEITKVCIYNLLQLSQTALLHMLDKYLKSYYEFNGVQDN